MFSFTDLIHYLRARFQVEEDQTMAEYGVVLAVIALGVVVALGLLSGAISGAIDRVRAIFKPKRPLTAVVVVAGSTSNAHGRSRPAHPAGPGLCAPIAHFIHTFGELTRAQPSPS